MLATGALNAWQERVQKQQAEKPADCCHPSRCEVGKQAWKERPVGAGSPAALCATSGASGHRGDNKQLGVIWEIPEPVRRYRGVRQEALLPIIETSVRLVQVSAKDAQGLLGDAARVCCCGWGLLRGHSLYKHVIHKQIRLYKRGSGGGREG